MDRTNTESLTPLLDKFLAGAASSEEKERLTGIFLSEENRSLFDEFSRRRWETSAGALDGATRIRLWRNIANEIAPARRRRLRNNKWLRTAAVAAAVVIAGLTGYYANTAMSEMRSPERFSVSVASGQKAGIVLPDGTRVWLNSMSTITYDDSYNKRGREVSLDGEAYFDVVSDPSRRFIVRTQGVAVEALGTEFNVKSYSDDDTVTASLREGRLQISHGESSVILNPLQRGEFFKSEGLIVKSSIEDMAAVDFWRNENLVFEAAPLGQIARTLERMYGVKVVFADKNLESISFSGKINNNSISNVFHIISLTYPISYSIKDDTVTIMRRQL